nr:uncharacterized protein LOC111502841 [Leptinotarsa decemlineata]
MSSKSEKRKRIKKWIKEEWQREWDNSMTERLLYRFCRTVGYESLDLSRKAVQLFTGHGNFPGYLARFNLAREVPCPCGRGEPETAEHVIERCMDGDRTGWREWKERLEQEKGGIQMKDRNGRRNERIRVANEWAESVVRDERDG